MKGITPLPADTDWDQLFFLAKKFYSMTLDEFLYDYNEDMVIDLINRHVDFMTGGISHEEVQPKETNARNFFGV